MIKVVPTNMIINITPYSCRTMHISPLPSFLKNPLFLKPRIPESLKAEKYSPQLPPSLIKRIKQYALEQDIKDYEVVQFTLEAYLSRKK